MQRTLFSQVSKNWRPIHYLGSKLRLVEPIAKIIDEIDPTRGTVCDLFAGSGTVSLALSRERTVISADIQHYSSVIGNALLMQLGMTVDIDDLQNELCEKSKEIAKTLRPAIEPLLAIEASAIQSSVNDPSLLCNIVESGSILGGHDDSIDPQLKRAKKECQERIERDNLDQKLMATQYFGGVYFSYDQAFQIDCFSEALKSFPQSIQMLGLASVLSTASDIVNSIGKQFAQPMRPRNKEGEIKQHLVKQICRDKLSSVQCKITEWMAKYLSIPRSAGHRVVTGDFRNILENECHDAAVVYADPPYTRDHYSRFYHVLETLCLRDMPTVSATRLDGYGSTSRGIYRDDRHQSPFCIKSKATSAFEQLFRRVANLKIPILLSYSPYLKNGHPRMVTVDSIVGLAKTFFDHVEVTTATGVRHSKLNKTELNLDALENGEVFITGV